MVVSVIIVVGVGLRWWVESEDAGDGCCEMKEYGTEKACEMQGS